MGDITKVIICLVTGGVFYLLWKSGFLDNTYALISALIGVVLIGWFVWTR